jgi:hypothetical protein
MPPAVLSWCAEPTIAIDLENNCQREALVNTPRSRRSGAIQYTPRLARNMLNAKSNRSSPTDRRVARPVLNSRLLCQKYWKLMNKSGLKSG